MSRMVGRASPPRQPGIDVGVHGHMLQFRRTHGERTPTAGPMVHSTRRRGGIQVDTRGYDTYDLHHGHQHRATLDCTAGRTASSRSLSEEIEGLDRYHARLSRSIQSEKARESSFSRNYGVQIPKFGLWILDSEKGCHLVLQ